MLEKLQPPPLFQRISAVARWRAELAPSVSNPAIRWAFMVTRLSPEAVGAFELMTKYVDEIPPEHRAIFDGARRRLAAYISGAA